MANSKPEFPAAHEELEKMAIRDVEQSCLSEALKFSLKTQTDIVWIEMRFWEISKFWSMAVLSLNRLGCG